MMGPEERNELFERLAEMLGDANAARLMEHLPPIPWHELATKEDLRLLEARLDARIDGLETRFDGLETHFDGLETHFDGLETHFDGLETHFDGLETRFDGLETRFDGLETHFDGVAGKTEGLAGQIAKLTGQFDGLQEQFRTFDTRLGGVEAGMRDLALSYATQMRTVILAVMSTIFAAVALIGLGFQLVR